MLARLVVLASLVVAIAGGCSGDNASATGDVGPMTLYSLDPDPWQWGDKPKRERPPNVEIFNNQQVLGKVEVTDLAQRRALFKALKESLAKKDVSQKKCFDPRHGVRTKVDGHDRDYVICFHCNNVFIHGKDAPQGCLPIGKDAEEPFNECLTRAGIKIAP